VKAEMGIFAFTHLFSRESMKKKRKMQARRNGN
jgi:hypothetical protein